MTLLDLQRVFSRMLTDSAYQRAVIDGDPSAISGYDLTTVEVACLRGLRRDRLAEHTGNLAHTRLEHGLRSLPRTERLAGPALRTAVGRYCREHPPIPEPRPTVLVESDRVARFVADLVAAGELSPPYVRDVVDYEATMLLVGYGKEAADSAQRITRLDSRADDAAVPVTGAHAVVREFGCDVVDLVRVLDAGEPPAAVPEAPTTLLFVKRAGLGEVHAARINAATALVLACCTGQAPVREVVFAVAAGLGARAPLDLAALERGVRASLAALARLGAVGFRGGAP